MSGVYSSTFNRLLTDIQIQLETLSAALGIEPKLDQLLELLRCLVQQTAAGSSVHLQGQALVHVLLSAQARNRLMAADLDYLWAGFVELQAAVSLDTLPSASGLTAFDDLLLAELVGALDEHAIISVADSEGKLIYVNDRLTQISGYSAEELIGQRDQLINREAYSAEFYESIWSTLASGQVWKGVLRNRSKQGVDIWVLATLKPINKQLGSQGGYVAIYTDITLYKKLKREAEKANRAKSEFLSSMSHELRTPMNAIIGFAQVLQYDDSLDLDQQDSVHEILRAGEHLLNLINEVLDLSKIESGHIDLSLESVNLKDLVAECKDLLAPVALRQGINLALDMAADYTVKADRTRLKQVLLNLLSNAIKYNRRNGYVHLEVSPAQNQHVRIAVIDNGPGIPLTKQALLFQPFQRLGAEASQIEGTGIGLSISQKLVDLMAGTIGMESQEGKGSCFWVELPLTEELTVDYLTLALSSEEKAPDQAGIKHQVLYIEDNPSNTKLVSQILAKRPQIGLLTAHEPELGLELAAIHKPKLILLDINMPGLNGYEVLARLRANPELCAIPVAALTASATPADIDRGRLAGFDHYLTKPINIPMLLALVDRLA